MEALAPFYRDLVDLNGTASRKRGWIILGGKGWGSNETLG